MQSIITRKGQITIPKEIRDHLKAKEGEKVTFVLRGDEVILKVTRGNILDLKGSVKPTRHPEDFEKVRNAVKKTISRKAVRGD